MLVERSWCIVYRHHRWCIYSLFAYLDLSWVLSTLFLFNSDFTFSYGQILAMFSVAPALLSTIELVGSSRRDLALFFRHLPGRCWAEVVYLVAGIELDPRECISLLQLASFLPHLLPIVRSNGGLGKWEDGEFPDSIV